MTDFQLICLACWVLFCVGVLISIVSAGSVHNLIFFTVKLPLQVVGGMVAYAASFGRQTYTISWQQGEKEYEIKIGW